MEDTPYPPYSEVLATLLDQFVGKYVLIFPFKYDK